MKARQENRDVDGLASPHFDAKQTAVLYIEPLMEAVKQAMELTLSLAALCFEPTIMSYRSCRIDYYRQPFRMRGVSTNRWQWPEASSGNGSEARLWLDVECVETSLPTLHDDWL